ncbi:MAG: diaminopimelate epimerase [Lachnospiraceae bacterium]|jgi:diaminopimelate epimerase|nr:diaminopimelate epimerase [Lachnospiraceae bacterium]
MEFTKMHGCGNDYIYINGFTQQVPIQEKQQLARTLSDRHFGVGSDGLIFINPSKIADFEMEMYNADGSRAEMCGNGIRCVGKYVYDHQMTNQTALTVESMGKIKNLNLTVIDGKVEKVCVDMGSPILEPRLIPALPTQETEHTSIINSPIIIEGTEWRMTCVSMGNPHAVVFVENVDDLVLDRGLGSSFEHNERFPNRTNTEFVKLLGRDKVQMRVWERGTGETLSCGTGCCAVAVAGVLNGLTDSRITVKVLGGELEIFWDQKSNRVFMTGPATEVFEGRI